MTLTPAARRHAERNDVELPFADERPIHGPACFNPLASCWECAGSGLDILGFPCGCVVAF